MKTFEHFERHPYFVGKEIRNEDYIYYNFFNPDTKEETSFKIHRQAGYKMHWRYETRSDFALFSFAPKSYERLKEKSTWFAEVIKQANACLEKRDRLRNLFINKE